MKNRKFQSILNLNGAKELNKIEQQFITGGIYARTQARCESNCPSGCILEYEYNLWVCKMYA